MILRLVDIGTVREVAEAAIEMYIFAKRYGIDELRGDAMGRLGWCWDVATDLHAAEDVDVNEIQGFLSPATSRRVYENTEADSPVRRWLVKCFAGCFGFDKGNTGTLPRGYLVDVLESYKSLGADSDKVTERVGDGCWCKSEEEGIKYMGRVKMYCRRNLEVRVGEHWGERKSRLLPL